MIDLGKAEAQVFVLCDKVVQLEDLHSLVADQWRITRQEAKAMNRDIYEYRHSFSGSNQTVKRGGGDTS